MFEIIHLIPCICFFRLSSQVLSWLQPLPLWLWDGLSYQDEPAVPVWPLPAHHGPGQDQLHHHQPHEQHCSPPPAATARNLSQPVPLSIPSTLLCSLPVLSLLCLWLPHAVPCWLHLLPWLSVEAECYRVFHQRSSWCSTAYSYGCHRHLSGWE